MHELFSPDVMEQELHATRVGGQMGRCVPFECTDLLFL